MFNIDISKIEIPDWVNYLAQDEDGEVHGFNIKPSIKDPFNMWDVTTDEGSSKFLSDGEYNPLWRTAIQRVTDLNDPLPKQGDIIYANGIECVVIEDCQSKKRNRMTEKTMPKWGEIVHIDGDECVVTSVGIKDVILRGHLDQPRNVFIHELDEYKPRTINFGGIEFPEPVQEPLEKGDAYFFVQLVNTPECGWTGSEDDYMRLLAGRIQRTKEAAELHRQALICVFGGCGGE